MGSYSSHFLSPYSCLFCPKCWHHRHGWIWIQAICGFTISPSDLFLSSFGVLLTWCSDLIICLSILFNFLFASPWLLMMLLFHMNFGAISFIFGKKPYWDFHRIYRKGACLLHKFFKKIILTLGLRFFLFFFFQCSL